MRSLEEEVLSLRGKALRMVANLKAKEEEVNKLQRTMDRQAEGEKKKEGEEAGGGGAEHGDSTATMYRVAKGLEEILLDMTRAMPQGFFSEVWTTLMRKTSIKELLDHRSIKPWGRVFGRVPAAVRTAYGDLGAKRDDDRDSGE